MDAARPRRYHARPDRGGCARARARVSRSIVMKPPILRVVFSVAVAVAAGLTAIGCEEPAADVPQAVLDQQARQAAAEKNLPKIPTTQELTTGPRQTIALGPLPLTMRVPASWKVEVAAGASLLR